MANLQTKSGLQKFKVDDYSRNFEKGTFECLCYTSGKATLTTPYDEREVSETELIGFIKSRYPEYTGKDYEGGEFEDYLTNVAWDDVSADLAEIINIREGRTVEFDSEMANITKAIHRALAAKAS